MVTGAAEHIPAVAAAPDTVDVSLISNKLRCLGQRSAVEVGEGSAALVLRSDAMAVTTVGADAAGECLTGKYSHCCAFRRETWLNLSKLTSLRRSPCFSSIPTFKRKCHGTAFRRGTCPKWRPWLGPCAFPPVGELGIPHLRKKMLWWWLAILFLCSTKMEFSTFHFLLQLIYAFKTSLKTYFFSQHFHQ